MDVPSQESKEKRYVKGRGEKSSHMHKHVYVADIQNAVPEDVSFIKPNPVKDEDAAKSLCYGFVMWSSNRDITEGKLDSIDIKRKR